jgi:hypothetical protein
MGRFLRTLTIIGATSFGLSTAAAEQVYKWVDQQGVTHYSEQAPADKTPETIRINSYQTESKPPESLPLAAGSEIQEPDSLADADVTQEQPPIQEQLPTPEQVAVQKQNCATARHKLRALKNAGRVRQLDAKTGQYIYLADEVKLAQIQQMSDYLRDKCRG